MGNRIVHFEIPAGDVEKLSKFYSDLFDWKFSKQTMPDPAGGMDYWMIQTTGMGPEHLAGGMYRKQDETDRPRFFVYVEDIDSHTEKLKQAGGTSDLRKSRSFQEWAGAYWLPTPKEICWDCSRQTCHQYQRKQFQRKRQSQRKRAERSKH